MPTRTKAQWESAFDGWAVGPAATEAEKCDNAERMVREALRAHPPLRGRNIKVFPQGSYRNRTNVRGDSDVDVCVLSMDTFFGDYQFLPAGTNNASMGFYDSSYQFPEFKQDIEDALVARFGDDVTKGSKAFDIAGNTYRPSADVVPTFEGRLYYPNPYGAPTYASGTVLQCNSTGRLIYNWPEQHYANGVQRHADTGRQFKKKARILKNLANEMAEDGFESAQKMSSFLLECLAYNGTEIVFNQPTHYEDMWNLIATSWTRTESDESVKGMLEVNGIKYLFHSTQPWNRADVHQFLSDAWHHVGFNS